MSQTICHEGVGAFDLPNRRESQLAKGLDKDISGGPAQARIEGEEATLALAPRREQARTGMAERAHPHDPGFHDSWFGLKKNKYKQKLYERYRFCNAHIKDRVILDIPCGSGWGTSLLKGYRRCTGIDIAEDAVAFAKKKYERPGTLEFVVGSMEKLPAGDASVDVIVCLEGFEHVDRDIGTAFLAEARRALKPGGLLLMTCPVLNEYGEDTKNPYHLCEYPEEELIDKLNRGFRIQNLERIQGPEGPEYRIVVQHFGVDRYKKR